MNKKNNPLESKIESYLKQQIKAVGGLCYKFKSTVNGVPDQLIIYDGTMHLIEVKRPGEKPRANQIHVHGQIEQQGVPVHVVDTEQATDDFILNVLKVENIPAPDDNNEVVIKSINAFK